MRTHLRAIGLGAGLDLVGFASADPFPEIEAELVRRRREGLSNRLGFTYSDPAAAGDLRQHFPWAATLVVGARSYLPAAGNDRAGHGRVAASARLPGYEPLRTALEAMASALAGEGHQAQVLCDDNRLVDRAAAVRAGIGWWGKSSMVLAPGLGPWFLLGTVVTSLELARDEPSTRSCGTCSACLPACPTGALVAPGVLDARLCLAAWAQTPGVVPVEIREAMGDRLYGCDACLDACPPGRSLKARGSDDGLTFDLGWVLWASDWTLLAHFGHWFLPDRDPRIIRRNALIAAANTNDRGLIEAIAPYTAHPDETLAVHARWALAQLERAPIGK